MLSFIGFCATIVIISSDTIRIQGRPQQIKPGKELATFSRGSYIVIGIGFLQGMGRWFYLPGPRSGSVNIGYSSLGSQIYLESCFLQGLLGFRFLGWILRNAWQFIEDCESWLYAENEFLKVFKEKNIWYRLYCEIFVITINNHIITAMIRNPWELLWYQYNFPFFKLSNQTKL